MVIGIVHNVMNEEHERIRELEEATHRDEAATEATRSLKAVLFTTGSPIRYFFLKRARP